MQTYCAWPIVPPLIRRTYVDVVRFPHPLKNPPLGNIGGTGFGESPAELPAGGVVAGSPVDSEVLLRGMDGVFIGPLKIFLNALTSSRSNASFVAGSWFAVDNTLCVFKLLDRLLKVDESALHSLNSRRPPFVVDIRLSGTLSDMEVGEV
jgi:hypothetical protein